MTTAVEQLAVHLVPGCSALRFVRLEATLLARGQPALLVASLQGEAILLGRHQRASSALSPSGLALPVVRRLAGGRAVWAGEGIFGVAMVLPRMGFALTKSATADKGLNRYVRPLLRGLTRVSPAPALWFGRDFVSVDGKSVAVVGQEALQGGALLFESIVAGTRTLELPPGAGGYPAHSDPRAAGPPAGVLGRGDFETLQAALTASHSELLGIEALPAPLPEEGAAPQTSEDEAGFEESGVADVPIGFCEALVRGKEGPVREVRLRGDFLAPAFVMAELEKDLGGASLDFGVLGALVDEAFHKPGGFIHGVRHLRVFADAVLAAAGAA